MSCFHPLVGWKVGKNLDTGKDIFSVKSYDISVVSAAPSDSYTLIPCGQCIGCRMDYAGEWSNRMLCELQMHDPSKCYFVTLTFSPESISKECRLGADISTGEAVPFWSLDKKHVQLFNKRLRQDLFRLVADRFPRYKVLHVDAATKVKNWRKEWQQQDPVDYQNFLDAVESVRYRFYSCGEYGGENHRCHYHFIFYNLCLPDGDLTFYKRSKHGDLYYNSKLLSMAWPYGFNVVTSVTPASIGYVARYMLKKQKGDDAFVYYNYDLEPPFTVCSRKPGIGAEYFRSVLKGDLGDSPIVLSVDDGIRKFYPPKYFERLLEQSDPEKAFSRKERRRKFAVDASEVELLATDLDEIEYLAVKEKNLYNRISVLYNRNMEL